MAPPARALAWVRRHELPTGGIRVHSNHASAYPEVTGYLVPTLLRYGERDIARRLVRWLTCIQRADGSFTDPDRGLPHVFDTGQVLRGLLEATQLVPSALDAARRAAAYLCAAMVDGGAGGFGDCYRGEVPETVHLYVLPPLLKAAQLFREPAFAEAAQRCLDFYTYHAQFLRIESLTHFLAYELEALIDLGRTERALPVLAEIERLQTGAGAVRAIDGSSWVCSPGLAQLALCWYKVGHSKPADSALAWLELHQRASGGFLGSYGEGAAYFASSELSWTPKFYLDAHAARVAAFFNRNAHAFPTTVAPTDGRAQAILSVVRPQDRVLEVGCGKGRFIKLVKERVDSDCTGVDISPQFLGQVGEGVRLLEGSLENIPVADDSQDVAFAVEAVEHSANIDAAVSEMTRVVRPGGWVIIIDKQQSQWGRLACPPWERWPRAETLSRMLRCDCDDVTAAPVSYDGAPKSDELMVVWKGRKRSRLTGSSWNKVLISAASQADVVRRVRANRLTEWALALHEWTLFGEHVLELGSGTGEISLQLAQAGRSVCLLDLDRDSLAFSRRCAQELGVALRTVQADAARGLPFPDEAFDCVWQSGLLEHFTPAERRVMHREWARVSARRVISVVPNASSVAYRVGKAAQEERGTWPYGLEVPLLSLREEFEEAGLRVVAEYSVGARHALNFLEPKDPLRRALGSWLDSTHRTVTESANQGYLLVTVGEKRAL